MFKNPRNISPVLTTAMLLMTTTMMGACGAADRIANIGKAPDLTQIEDPTLQRGYQPVSLPMPAPKDETRQMNSLWSANKNTFFGDQRATDIGDIVTVVINIDDTAEIENESSRSRNSSENAGLAAGLGYEQALNAILPEAVDNTNLVELESDSVHSGTGSIEREEAIEVQMAALINQILPNGNFVIQGRQEVRVNFEKRILEITGVIRPEDITIDNTISYEKIAEARISYGGEGQITDVQQPRYGQQLYDVIFPF